MMASRFRGFAIGLALALLPAGEAFAQAPAQIGVAARANGAVSGQLGTRKTIIATGSQVFQNQIVTTAADAGALLNFRDSTHLEVGPSSRVTLDRYVFNPDGGAKSAIMSMTSGSFRFVTGISDPRSIKLQTPQATIGIRGTILEIEVSGGRTVVNVVRGAIVLCLRSNDAMCSDVIGEGGSVSATSTAIDVGAAPQSPGPSFEDRTGRDSGGGGPSDGGGGSTGGSGSAGSNSGGTSGTGSPGNSGL